MNFRRDNRDEHELTQKKIDDYIRGKKNNKSIIDDSQKWASRKKAYPNLADQLDMLWHDMDSGKITVDKTSANTWYSTIKDIKETHPL